GLGGRDLSAEVGGISALSALNILKADNDSQVIAFVSKPPAESVRQQILQAMQQMGKPVVALFLGSKPKAHREGNVWLAQTLDEAARLATLLARVQCHLQQLPDVSGKHITGLYSGGTLAAEAATLLADHLSIAIDTSHPQGVMLEGQGHKIIDLGDDFYTQGKPHPMIDPTTRSQQIIALSERPDIGVLLLDVVLGYGAQADPAGALLEAVGQMRTLRDAAHPLVVITTVTGSEQDPQQRSQQIEKLTQAGIVVAGSLPEAVLLAQQCISATATVCCGQETPALLQQTRVINVGLRSFADNLQACGVPVVHYQWAPVAGGNKRLAGLLKKLQ
ncbi:MAG: acyl-CoA synthetase FdrA, partial [Enterobacteriaceae bacterium]